MNVGRGHESPYWKGTWGNFKAAVATHLGAYCAFFQEIEKVTHDCRIVCTLSETSKT